MSLCFVATTKYKYQLQIKIWILKYTDFERFNFIFFKIFYLKKKELEK